MPSPVHVKVIDSPFGCQAGSSQSPSAPPANMAMAARPFAPAATYARRDDAPLPLSGASKRQRPLPSSSTGASAQSGSPTARIVLTAARGDLASRIAGTSVIDRQLVVFASLGRSSRE